MRIVFAIAVGFILGLILGIHCIPSVSYTIAPQVIRAPGPDYMQPADEQLVQIQS